MNLKTIVFAATLLAMPGLLHAQFDFKVAGEDVQIHSFGSQGFAASDGNNYLTMPTSKGSFAMTDGGANISTQLTDKLRISAQVYDRNIGKLGQWRPQLDFAFADYRFKDWFGIRGGVVKTVFGLENDTQDYEFLHNSILLPQSVYPTDLRDTEIRHRGGDVYGVIPIKRLGSLAYNAYAGLVAESKYGGYILLLDSEGANITSYGGLQVGEDLRWNTPLNGLIVGASHMGNDTNAAGFFSFGGGPGLEAPYTEYSKRDYTNQFYGVYTIGNLRLASEYKKYWRDEVVFNGLFEGTNDVRAWYLSSSYRFSKRFELGGYYSRWTDSYWNNAGLLEPASQNNPDRHLYDKVVTARVDLNPHWNVKAEGHFINGYGTPEFYTDGFYGFDNPQGLKPKTTVLLISTGFNY